MIQSSAQQSFNSIVSSGEQIYALAKDQDITGLETKLPEYTKNIEQYFLGLDKEQLTQTDFEDLKQVMSTHKKIVLLLNEEKKKTAKNIKQLHNGKEMQNTYPQTLYS